MAEHEVHPESYYRKQRKMKNYLIDKRFQLKYTFMIAGLSAVLVVALGFPLYKTVADSSDQLVARMLSDDTYASDAQADLLVQTVEAEKRRTLVILGAFLAALLLGLVLTGIFVTHKVAGPVFKIKKLMRAVTGDRLHLEGKLRKGDELVELFESFNDMITRLREHQQLEATHLAAMIEKLAAADDDAKRAAAMKELREFGDRMQAALK